VVDLTDPRTREVFFDVHSDLPREGPGNRASTLRALAAAGPLPANPAILDMACGPGMQTLDLALALPGAGITALDMHRPFLAEVASRAAAAGCADRIQTLRADMADPPLEPGQFDLIWCEGAVYMLGIGEALRLWRPLLRPGGIVAFTEPVWLTSNPSARALRNWVDDYLAMADVAGIRSQVEAAGYKVLSTFTLPPEAWWVDYYGPLEARIPQLRVKYGNDPIAKQVLDAADDEVEAYRLHADEFGYEFVIARANP
jgi:SAM-dependent methyltransferase